MSGGYFNYDQFRIGYIASSIEKLILRESSSEVNEWGSQVAQGYSAETLKEFARAASALRIAEIYTQRVDWLVSGDDGETEFHSRLARDLLKIGVVRTPIDLNLDLLPRATR